MLQPQRAHGSNTGGPSSVGVVYCIWHQRRGGYCTEGSPFVICKCGSFRVIVGSMATVDEVVGHWQKFFHYHLFSVSEGGKILGRKAW